MILLLGALAGRADFAAPPTAEEASALVELEPFDQSSDEEILVPATTQEEGFDLSGRTIPGALGGILDITVRATSQGRAPPFLRGFTGDRMLFPSDGIPFKNSVFREAPNGRWARPLSSASRPRRVQRQEARRVFPTGQIIACNKTAVAKAGEVWIESEKTLCEVEIIAPEGKISKIAVDAATNMVADIEWIDCRLLGEGRPDFEGDTITLSTSTGCVAASHCQAVE